MSLQYLLETDPAMFAHAIWNGKSLAKARHYRKLGWESEVDSAKKLLSRCVFIAAANGWIDLVKDRDVIVALRVASLQVVRGEV